ncbi:hypothetical protein ACJJTC_004099, partial [Scirpophaga incertulas]
MFSTNHKTIFVLDHTPYFGISSDYPIDFDTSKKGKLVRLVVSDSAAHILNTWETSEQNLTHLLNGLSLVGPVRRGAGGDVVGLVAAIESLSEASPIQASNSKLIGLYRIEVALFALLVLPPASPNASNTPPSLVIHYCHLVIINVAPEKVDTRVTNQPLTEMGGGLMGVEVIVTRAITGIPMKEEQNASSSANYDVEIIHSIEAHAGLRASQTPAEAAESVVLRWWTPRGAEGGASSCSGPLWRVTPSDVASRPSACLVNFLLNGRSVTLEVPRKGGGRSASHVLAAQGGELWIGALGGRTPYDDPPALSEGAGGRVTDYRIKEFGALMQLNRLGPLRGSAANGRARTRLQRHTTYWPLTISSTLIFNLGSV